MSTRLNALRERIENVCLEKSPGIKVAQAAFFSLDPTTNKYLSHFTGSNSALLINAKEALFFTDFRYREQAEGEVISNFKRLEADRSLDEALVSEVKARRIKLILFEPDRLSYGRFLSLKEKLDRVEFLPAKGLTEEVRTIKDRKEIEQIERAVQVADVAFAELFDLLKPGVTERMVATELGYMMQNLGAEKPSFDIIVLFGSRSSLPHGRPGERRLKNGDIVLVDMGACVQGYHSDLTRVVFFGKIKSTKIKQIYGAVLEAQEQAIDAIRPGLSAKDLDAVARASLEKGGYASYFGHGLGHGVGLEIHEKPVISSRSLDVVEKGMVFTVEPGVYIPDLGGVRIEDMVLVTQSGVTVLTAAAKELQVI